MKNRFLFIIMAVAAASIVSCEKSPDNGDPGTIVNPPEDEPQTNDYFLVSTDELVFPSQGGIHQIRVSSDTAWDMVPSADWITLTIVPGTSVEGSETDAIDVRVEPSIVSRTGSITISDGKNFLSVKVVQNAQLVGHHYPGAFFQATDPTKPETAKTGVRDNVMMSLGRAANYGQPGGGTGPLLMINFAVEGIDITKPSYEIPAGTYDVDGWCVWLENGGTPPFPDHEGNTVAGGTITFEGTSREYTITTDITLVNGRKVEGFYIGELYWPNYLVTSTFTEAYEIPELHRGRLTMVDDPMNNATNDWLFEAWTRDIYFMNGSLMGNGTVVQLMFCDAPNGSETILPNGTYPLAETFEKGNAMYGNSSPGEGCWVLVYDGDGYQSGRTPLQEGEIKFNSTLLRTDEADGKDIYKVEIDIVAYDSNQNRISGTFSSEIKPAKVSAPAPPTR